MKKSELQEMTFGMHSGKHEDMTDVLQGWDKRVEEMEEHNAKGRSKSRQKKTLLPSDVDPEYTYGMTTHDIDVKNDPFLRSNAVIAARIAKQEAEERRMEERIKNNKVKPKRRLDPTRPTAASIGHTKHAPPEPALKDTFKMKRFTQIDHGVIDTGKHK